MKIKEASFNSLQLELAEVEYYLSVYAAKL